MSTNALVQDGPPNWPQPDRARPFEQPWQAQAFAMVVALEQAGHFSKAEWAQALGNAIQAAQAKGDPDTGENYYLHWLAALESLVQEKTLASASVLSNTRSAWKRAAGRTAHGKPIELLEQDFAQGGTAESA